MIKSRACPSTQVSLILPSCTPLFHLNYHNFKLLFIVIICLHKDYFKEFINELNLIFQVDHNLIKHLPDEGQDHFI